MSAIDNTPENKNFLSPLNFKFEIRRAPHVNFFIQKINIPDIKLPPIDIPNQFVNVPIHGDHMDYGLLNITFKVDEDLQNYLEIHNWIKALGKPKDFEDFKIINREGPTSGKGKYSDISLFVLSSTKMVNYEIVFVDAFPFELSGVTFNTTDNDVKYIEASATFKYTYYDINKI